MWGPKQGDSLTRSLNAAVLLRAAWLARRGGQERSLGAAPRVGGVAHEDLGPILVDGHSQGEVQRIRAGVGAPLECKLRAARRGPAACWLAHAWEEPAGRAGGGCEHLAVGKGWSTFAWAPPSPHSLLGVSRLQANRGMADTHSERVEQCGSSAGVSLSAAAGRQQG